MEVATAIDSAMGTDPAGPEAHVALVGTSILHALGMVGGLRIRDSAGRDVTEREFSSEGPEFARAMKDLRARR